METIDNKSNLYQYCSVKSVGENLRQSLWQFFCSRKFMIQLTLCWQVRRFQAFCLVYFLLDHELKPVKLINTIFPLMQKKYLKNSV